MKTVRCAIYTRKSSEEGLEQGFNSLDAQREACAAYILSQASEGWSALPDIYDDGGISGGTLERPALQRLLADVAAGRVDIIVVYKVDRLTRSLLDFAKLVEAFDRANVSFVSITQSFNTTTSMGRLTLNMLLSFAQFEREVTAERIRDKIAASKAKGMWMGGVPPLGYQPDGRSLAIVAAQAQLVRDIFARYCVLGNVRVLAEMLLADGILTPRRTSATGKTHGGRPFTRGQLYHMLRNRLYLGEIQHRDRVYPGLHAAIIDPDLWDRAQARLAESLQGSRTRHHARQPSLLAGLITDMQGEPLIATHATKAIGSDGGRRRYRYYVSRNVHHGAAQAGWRIPAREIETAVVTRLARALEDPLDLIAGMGVSLQAVDLRLLQARGHAAALAIRSMPHPLLAALLSAVVVAPDTIRIICDAQGIACQLGIGETDTINATVTLVANVRLSRSGTALRLVQASGSWALADSDPALARMIVQAHRYWRILRSEPIDITALARREGKSTSWIARMLRLAFLSPAVTQAILSGGQKASVDVAALKASDAVDPLWDLQAARFLPGQ